MIVAFSFGGMVHNLWGVYVMITLIKLKPNLKYEIIQNLVTNKIVNDMYCKT
jgi:hypothetical protein